MKRLLSFALILLALGCCNFAAARTFLVAVGVAEYADTTTTRIQANANDARAIADFFKENDTLSYVLLINQEATCDRIIRAMRKVYSQAQKDDKIILFFSGHGYPGDDYHPGGVAVYDGFISYTQIREAMAVSPCVNKMIFANACHSGGIRQEAIASQQGDDHGATSSANVLTFMSSRTDEYSYSSAASSGNSLFARNLLAAMRGAADADNNGIITAKELFTYVYQGVLRDSYQTQHPVMWGRFPNDMPIITLRK